MAEKMNLITVRSNESVSEQGDISGATLDFFLTSKVNIKLLNEKQEVVGTIESVENGVLGEIIMRKMGRNLAGDLEDFSFIQIENEEGNSSLPIDSHMVKKWAYRTADDSNAKPILKQQTGADGTTTSYVRQNGTVKVIKTLKDK